MAPGARELVEEGQGASEACQEGSTDGECSTHTPPSPKIRKMHFSFPHILLTRVLFSGVVV